MLLQFINNYLFSLYLCFLPLFFSLSQRHNKRLFLTLLAAKPSPTERTWPRGWSLPAFPRRSKICTARVRKIEISTNIKFVFFNSKSNIVPIFSKFGLKYVKQNREQLLQKNNFCYVLFKRNKHLKFGVRFRVSCCAIRRYPNLINEHKM